MVTNFGVEYDEEKPLEGTYPSRKFSCPTLPRTILHREPLVTHLQEAIARLPQKDSTRASYKVVMLCAPAGFGKTTLLADFACSTSIPCSWYFLDSADKDHAVFINNLLTSLRCIFPHFGKMLDAFFNNLFAGSSLSVADAYRTAIDTLCSTITLEISEHFALHLCNYEEINGDNTMNALLTHLLKKMPSQMTLVIESRIMPDISLVPLLIREEVFGLSSDSLRFSAQEISELARLQGLTTLSEAETEKLATSFDGWIAGILLCTLLGDMHFFPFDKEIAENQPISHLHEKAVSAQKLKNLFAYVANEVFRHDMAMYAFLQVAAILQQMEPAICNELLEITNADEYLERLEQQGLFVTSHRDAAQAVYVCHPLIRDLLSEDLRRREPARFVMLHRKAAAYWHACLNYDQAMHHAMMINAHDLEVQIILGTYKQLLQQGYVDTVTRWLEHLPPTLKEKHLGLLMVQVNIDLIRGQSDTVLQTLDKIVARIALLSDKSDPAETQILEAETLILHSKALFQIGDYSRAQVLCRQALARLPNNEIELRVAAEMRLGICANLQGDFNSGLIHLQHALHIWKNQPPISQAVDIHGALANTYFLIGNFALAEHHLIHALDYCEQLHDEQRKIDNFIRKGLLHLYQGAYPEAETALVLALTLARTSLHDQRGEAYALANLGSLYLEQEMYAQALVFCEDGLTLAQQYGNRSLINTTISNIATIYLLMGDVTSALLFAEKIRIQEMDEKAVGYERAERDLTYGLTLLYQQRYDEAYACLAKIDADLQTINLKRAQLQVKLRLASCQLARNQEADVVRLLKEVTLLLASNENYKQLVFIELKRQSALLQKVKGLPQLVRLRELLGLVVDEKEVHYLKSSSASQPVAKTRTQKLAIRAFGEPTVYIDDQPVKRWRMARALELFFYLLDSSTPLSKERIITALWPEFDDNVNQTFHSTLHHLRKLLGESCFVFDTRGYSLDLAAGYGENVWYDVKEFAALRVEADEALASGDDVVARTALLAMVKLYQGDYGRPFYNDWCIFRRDELSTSYLEAQRQLAQIAWRRQMYDESIYHWRQILKVDNCQEEAHYHVMLCYLRQSKRTAALRQYQSCKEILQQELSIKPGSAIEKLYHSLRAGVEI